MERPQPDESIYDEVAPRVDNKTGYYAVHDPSKHNINNNGSIPRRSSAILLSPDMAIGVDNQKTVS